MSGVALINIEKAAKFCQSTQISLHIIIFREQCLILNLFFLFSLLSDLISLTYHGSSLPALK